ncbi:hypothetical protein PGT21_020993 [Puccinia graminis f. sp. tritici]|uniref:Uncharacterized protein n=1 Tax=Puccinia graminis f. sp. tritici TaxID=56615 RepID=A0A5B0SI20_PUCGR|nr:hypothetical protein PGT21_020993 [Puccinia graminis f. sp. tritici]KAA1130271.1 hypothetical protein PGTUg99_001365 [Puccinia graminis f. sp. tritici]KAA1136833.1 hypothetical protein PGTUg99_004565 [Puccinia graminis f. sp. tritici]
MAVEIQMRESILELVQKEVEINGNVQLGVYVIGVLKVYHPAHESHDEESNHNSNTINNNRNDSRVIYLADRKGFLPVDEVLVPRRLEGDPSSRPFRGRVSEDTRSDTRCGRRIPASGCGCGFGCSDGRKKQPDIRMPIDHL